MTESCCHSAASTPESGSAPRPEPAPVPAPATIALYRPLLAPLALSLAGGAALSAAHRASFMNGAMGLFLLFLAAQQLQDLRGYARLFAGYDPLARRSAAYARAYPFIGAMLGLAYLAGWWPLAVNAVMLVVMLATTLGVAGILRAGQKLRCGCAGAAAGLPVGRVTLIEYGTMAAMAAVNLLSLAA